MQEKERSIELESSEAKWRRAERVRAALEANKQIGIGGAPTRATTLRNDPAGRKAQPVASGVLDYFPDALVAVAEVSYAGNEQHNPGQPLHWAREKSIDESDAMLRHFMQRGTLDEDGKRHSAKMVWRALALLQKEIDAEPHPKEGINGPQPEPASEPSFPVGEYVFDSHGGRNAERQFRAVRETEDPCLTLYDKDGVVGWIYPREKP